MFRNSQINKKPDIEGNAPFAKTLFYVKILCIVIKQYVCYDFYHIKSGQGSVEQF